MKKSIGASASSRFLHLCASRRSWVRGLSHRGRQTIVPLDIRRRNAADHLAFGLGVHFCLGAHLARMELRTFLQELLPRIEAMELAGEPEYTASTFVGGPKHVPIRYRLRAAPSL
ncbi:MAG: cytochrome P450 [Deltaproteobacteria bacterium]|nr:cytochrome P450 [Deltaproteobacteria bacterium]